MVVIINASTSRALDDVIILETIFYLAFFFNIKIYILYFILFFCWKKSNSLVHYSRLYSRYFNTQIDWDSSSRVEIYNAKRHRVDDGVIITLPSFLIAGEVFFRFQFKSDGKAAMFLLFSVKNLFRNGHSPEFQSNRWTTNEFYFDLIYVFYCVVFTSWFDIPSTFHDFRTNSDHLAIQRNTSIPTVIKLDRTYCHRRRHRLGRRYVGIIALYNKLAEMTTSNNSPQQHNTQIYIICMCAWPEQGSKGK